jgi:hypothetical protein
VLLKFFKYIFERRLLTNSIKIMANSGESSPMSSRFSGSDIDFLGSFDPSYTAEISNMMRVPKKIRIGKSCSFNRRDSILGFIDLNRVQGLINRSIQLAFRYSAFCYICTNCMHGHFDNSTRDRHS